MYLLAVVHIMHKSTRRLSLSYASLAAVFSLISKASSGVVGKEF